jgi:hypothetical protein
LGPGRALEIDDYIPAKGVHCFLSSFHRPLLSATEGVARFPVSLTQN